VCFQITPTSDIAAIYNSIMPDAFEPGSISVTPANDKIIISAAMPKRPLSPLELQLFKVPSIASSQTWEYPYKSMFAPKFMAITPTAGKINSQSSSDGSFALFIPEKYYVVVPEKNVLYYYGFALDKKKKDQLNLFIDEFKF
jgi:hypothetical protein